MIGEVIKELRAKRYMTQVELAEASGLSGRYVSALETGRKNPLLSTLRKLAKGLDLPLALIIHLSKDELSADDSQLQVDMLFHVDSAISAKNKETFVQEGKM